MSKKSKKKKTTTTSGSSSTNGSTPSASSSSSSSSSPNALPTTSTLLSPDTTDSPNNPSSGKTSSVSSSTTYGSGAPMPPVSSIPPPFNPSSMASSSSSSSSHTLSPRMGTSKLPKTVIQEREKGITYYKRGDLVNAHTAFSKAIVLTPSDHASLPSLFTRRALCNLRMNQNEAAIDDARRALEINPKFVKAYVCRGVGYFRLMKYQNANDDYTTASKLQQGNQRFQEALATAKKEAIASRDFFDTNLFDALLLSIDDNDCYSFEEESASNRKASTKSSEHSEKENITSNKGKGGGSGTTTTTGKSGKGDNKPKDALSDVPLLVPVGEYLSSPLNLPAGVTAAKIALQSVREKELGNNAFQALNFLVALDHYSKAIRLNPQEPVFFSNRALVYLKLGRYYESITDATTSIERKPSIKAYARRAAAWASLKEHLLAVDDYKHALEFEPKNLECLQEFHRCLACLEQEFKAKLQSNPQNEKWKEAIRHTVEEKKQVDMRIQAVQKSNQQPTPQSGVNNPGSISSSVGGMGCSSSPTGGFLSKADLDASILYFTNELNLDPNNSEALLRRGDLYLQRGDYDKAMNDFKGGLHRDPDNKDLLQGLKHARMVMAGTSRQ